jgi:hypothetical protein
MDLKNPDHPVIFGRMLMSKSVAVENLNIIINYTKFTTLSQTVFIVHTDIDLFPDFPKVKKSVRHSV